MSNNNDLKKMSSEELSKYAKLVDSTIESLLLELRSSSKTKSNQANMRLDFWEEKKFELDIFLQKNHNEQ